MLKFGIIGAGHIAGKVGCAMEHLRGEIEPYAVASRDLGKAQDFAKRHGFAKAYGSYEELVSDPGVDVVYVATLNSFHLEHTKLALEHGKHVLCEKPFALNEAQAGEMFELADEKGLFISEALWTRFLPTMAEIRKIIASGEIGEVKTITGVFGRSLAHVPRIRLPELGGGGLLDLGIYPLHFVFMFMGEDYISMMSKVVKTPEGVDAQTAASLEYDGGRMAFIMSSMVSFMNEPGIISGTKGRIIMNSLLRSERVTIEFSDQSKRLIKCPFEFNGYEYELRGVAAAIAAGKKECAEIPHLTTMKALRFLDRIRRDGGVVFPCEKK